MHGAPDLARAVTSVAAITKAKIKFEYVEIDFYYPTNYVAEIYYWDPITEWNKLYSDYSYGYLHNGWYTLRIEMNGEDYLNYYLNQSNGWSDSGTGGKLTASLNELDRIEFTSEYSPLPTVCPIFFWDEHRLGLTYP